MKHRMLILRFVVSAGREHAWQSLKNRAKFFLHRKPYISERMRFLRQYLLHATGMRPIRAVTYAYRADDEGPGSQANCIMNAINFARASGLTYVHTPFTIVAHADRPMPQWVAAWESLFNLGAGEVQFDSAKRDVVNYSPVIYKEIELCLGWRGREDELARSFNALISEFRRKYDSNKPPSAEPRRTRKEVTVAVHMRRGDVTAQNRFMFTSTQKVRRTLSVVKSMLDARRVRSSIRVYSEGNLAEFAELAALGVEFFLNADPIWTMQELIEADVLVLAKSSFSSYAGVISSGIKIYEPCDWSEMAASVEWILRNPPDDWLPCQADGSIDEAALDRQLSLHAGRQIQRGHAAIWL